MSQDGKVREQDIAALREWLATQPAMPQNFDDIVLKKFLFSCDGDVESARKCLEKFCTDRASFPEAYTGRDPTSTGLRNAFSITRVTTYRAGDQEILIHQLVDTSPDKFDFYDGVKAFSLHADNWLQEPVDPLPEGHIVVLDIKLYTLMMLPRVNVFFYKKFLLYLIECMPVRLRQVHAVNCPYLYEFLYSLIKPVLPRKVTDLIKFHADAEGLHQYIDKQYLPKEYGGDAESMETQNERWVAKIQGKRDLFMNDNMWKVKASAKETKKTADAEETQPPQESLSVMKID